MESLVDDCLRMVFKLVNLNDRASLRSMNKRFKAVCDNIPIRKLIVSERMAAEPGQLAYTNEEYAYADTANCFDLAMLFKNPILLKQMTRLRVLTITGTRLPASQLDLTKFDQLNYLSLSQVLLNSPKVLESPNLNYLIMDHAYVKTADEKKLRIAHLGLFGQSFGSEPITVHTLGLDHLKSSNLKYLKLRGNRALEHSFFDYCARNQLFDSLEELDVVIDDLRSIPLLSESCPNLKVINARAWNDHFFDIVRSTDMPNHFFARIKKNLKLYFFGIEFKEHSFSEVVDFLWEFQSAVHFFNSMRGMDAQLDILECPINEKILPMIKKMAKKHDLTGFYRAITQVQFRLPCVEYLKEAAFFRKMVNCETLYFDLADDVDARLMKYFDYFEKLRCVRIEVHGLRDFNMTTAMLKELPKRCPRILVLMFESKDPKTNFDFLFEFQQLSTIIVDTDFEFNPATYVKLMRKLKSLFRLDVRYVVPSNVNRDKLRAFKQLVLSALKERSDSDKLDFKLNIYTERNSFARCHLKPKELECIVEEQKKLYAWGMMAGAKRSGLHMSTLRLEDLMK